MLSRSFQASQFGCTYSESGVDALVMSIMIITQKYLWHDYGHQHFVDNGNRDTS